MAPARKERRRKRCGATKRDGGTCQRWALAGRDRCSLHGGKSPIGTASPHYAGKGYSRVLPQRLVDAYLTMRNDPDLLVFNDNIALVETRIHDLLKRVDTGESGSLWKELRSAWQAFVQASQSSDEDARRDAMRAVASLIQRGHQDAVLWDQIGDHLDLSRRLKDSERRRRMDAQASVTAEQALAFATTLADTVKRHVKDPATLRLINADFAAILQSGRVETGE